MMSESQFSIIRFLADIDDDKVYISHTTDQNGLFVLRVLSPQTLARARESVSTLVHIGHTLRALDHPNIKPVIAQTTQESHPALVMPYYEGQSAADFLRGGQAMSVERVVRVALKLVEALEAAHTIGVYHGAIRPEGVILGVNGTVLLDEWGSNLLLPSDWKTAKYVAPEIRAGNSPSAHGDIWSLGALIYRLLTLEHPNPAQPLHALVPDCPLTLSDLVGRMLASDPYARPYHAVLVGQALERERPPQERTLFTPRRLPLAGLPMRAGAFFGRTAELVMLINQLHRPTSHLISVCGPAGSGRTALVIEAAHRLFEQATPDGVWMPDTAYFVRFTPDARPEQVIIALNLITGEPFEYRLDVLQQVIDFLTGQRALLILDDLDYFPEGLVWVSTLLQNVQTVKCLVTSERPLGLPEEVSYSLSGLSLPVDVNDVDSPCVRLFEYAARRRDPFYTLTSDILPDLIRLCRRVGGAPLSIVLAAGGVGELGMGALTTLISEALNVSATSDLNLARIRAVCETVWQRIPSDEREILIRLSVIRGEISAEAAHILGRATVEQVRSLVGRSLLQRVPETGNLMLHPLIHRYALDWFATNQNANHIWHDHSAYYLRMLNREGRRTVGAGQVEAAHLITANLDNIRPAWHWAIEHQLFETLDDVSEALYGFLVFSLRLDEGDLWMTPVVEGLNATPPTPRRDAIMAGLLFFHSILARHDQLSNVALRCLEQAESLNRAGWSLRVNLYGLYARGLFELSFGSTQKARAVLEQMLTLALYEYNPRSELIASLFLGAAHYQRSTPDRLALERGKSLLKRTLELCHQLGDDFAAGVAYLHYGMLHAIAKDPQTAQDLFTRGLNAAAKVNNPRTTIPLLTYMTELHIEQGQHALARATLDQLLHLSKTNRHPWAVIVAQTTLVQVSLMEGDYHKAREQCQTLLRNLQTEPRAISNRAKIRCIYAYALCCLGEFEPAIEQIRVAMDDLDDSDPMEMGEVWSWLAVVTYWAREAGETTVVFENVLERYGSIVSAHHRALLYAGHANSAIRLKQLEIARTSITRMTDALHEVVSYDYRGSALLNLINPRIFCTLVMVMWLNANNRKDEARTRIHSIIPMALQTQSPHMMLQTLVVGATTLMDTVPLQACTWTYAVIRHPQTPVALRNRLSLAFEAQKASISPRILLAAAARAETLDIAEALGDLRSLL